MEKNQIQEALERLEEQLEGQPDEDQLNVISQELDNLGLQPALTYKIKIMIGIQDKLNELMKTTNLDGVFVGIDAVLRMVYQNISQLDEGYLKVVTERLDMINVWLEEIEGVEAGIEESDSATYEDMESRINKLCKDLSEKSKLLSDSPLFLNMVKKATELTSYDSKTIIKKFVQQMDDNESIKPKKGDRLHDLITKRPEVFKKAMIRCMKELESSDMVELKRLLRLEEYYKEIVLFAEPIFTLKDLDIGMMEKLMSSEIRAFIERADDTKRDITALFSDNEENIKLKDGSRLHDIVNMIKSRPEFYQKAKAEYMEDLADANEVVMDRIAPLDRYYASALADAIMNEKG